MMKTFTHPTDNTKDGDYTNSDTGLARIKKTVNSVTRKYVQDGEDVIGYYTTDGTEMKTFVTPFLDENLLMERPNEEEEDYGLYFYFHDGLGSVVNVVRFYKNGETWTWDATGTDRYVYYAFGAKRGGTQEGSNKQWDNREPIQLSETYEPVNQDFEYTGRRFDDESGLQESRARTYDQLTGRWLSIDPAGMLDGPNRYLFNKNNPIMFTDCFGLYTRRSVTIDNYGDNTIWTALPFYGYWDLEKGKKYKDKNIWKHLKESFVVAYRKTVITIHYLYEAEVSIYQKKASFFDISPPFISRDYGLVTYQGIKEKDILALNQVLDKFKDDKNKYCLWVRRFTTPDVFKDAVTKMDYVYLVAHACEDWPWVTLDYGLNEAPMVLPKSPKAKLTLYTCYVLAYIAKLRKTAGYGSAAAGTYSSTKVSDRQSAIRGLTKDLTDMYNRDPHPKKTVNIAVIATSQELIELRDESKPVPGTIRLAPGVKLVDD